jgi:hypothetical protein
MQRKGKEVDYMKGNTYKKTTRGFTSRKSRTIEAKRKIREAGKRACKESE